MPKRKYKPKPPSPGRKCAITDCRSKDVTRRLSARSVINVQGLKRLHLRNSQVSIMRRSAMAATTRPDTRIVRPVSSTRRTAIVLSGFSAMRSWALTLTGTSLGLHLQRLGRRPSRNGIFGNKCSSLITHISTFLRYCHSHQMQCNAMQELPTFTGISHLHIIIIIIIIAHPPYVYGLRKHRPAAKKQHVLLFATRKAA